MVDELLLELTEALRLLHDAQNGPPLLGRRHEAFWNTAMNKAQSVLCRAEGFLESRRLERRALDHLIVRE